MKRLLNMYEIVTINILMIVFGTRSMLAGILPHAWQAGIPKRQVSVSGASNPNQAPQSGMRQTIVVKTPSSEDNTVPVHVEVPASNVHEGNPAHQHQRNDPSWFSELTKKQSSISQKPFCVPIDCDNCTGPTGGCGGPGQTCTTTF